MTNVGHDPIFCHPRMWLAGIHPEMSKMDAGYKLSDMIVRSIPVTMEMKWNKAGQ